MILLYNEKGKAFETGHPDAPSMFTVAKMITEESTDTDLFFIAIKDNVPYSVNNTDVRHKKQDLWKFRAVNEESFDYYLKYLRTGNEVNYTRARRGINDG